MTKEDFITARTKIISDMLDNSNEVGVYQTSKAFAALDDLYDIMNTHEHGDSEAQKIINKKYADGFYYEIDLLDDQDRTEDNDVDIWLFDGGEVHWLDTNGVWNNSGKWNNYLNGIDLYPLGY